MVETLAVERFADRADAAVHHVAWGDHVAAGLGLHEGLRAEHRDRLVVEDLAIADDAVLAVGGVGVECDVADHADAVVRVLDGANGAAHEVVGVCRFVAVLGFELRGCHGEYGDRRDAERLGVANCFHHEIDTQALDARASRESACAHLAPLGRTQGQMRSAGVTVDSRVRRRTQSWLRLRRIRVLGNSGVTVVSHECGEPSIALQSACEIWGPSSGRIAVRGRLFDDDDGAPQLTLIHEDKMDAMGIAAFASLKRDGELSQDPAINEYVRCVVVAILEVIPPGVRPRRWTLGGIGLRGHHAQRVCASRGKDRGPHGHARRRDDARAARGGPRPRGCDTSCCATATSGCRRRSWPMRRCRPRPSRRRCGARVPGVDRRRARGRRAVRGAPAVQPQSTRARPTRWGRSSWLRRGSIPAEAITLWQNMAQLSARGLRSGSRRTPPTKPESRSSEQTSRAPWRNTRRRGQPARTPRVRRPPRRVDQPRSVALGGFALKRAPARTGRPPRRSRWANPLE